VLHLEIIMIAVFIAVPFIMLALAAYVRPIRLVFHALALLSFYSAGSVLALAVYRTVLHGTVLTTNVHTILMDPWLLFPGAYLGLYIPYRMLGGFVKKNQPQ